MSTDICGLYRNSFCIQTVKWIYKRNPAFTFSLIYRISRHTSKLSTYKYLYVKGLIQSVIQTASQSFSRSGCQHPRGFHFQIVSGIQFGFIRTDSEKPSQSDITMLNALSFACVTQRDLCQGESWVAQTVWQSSHLISEVSGVSRWPFPAEREMIPPVPSSTLASVC